MTTVHKNMTGADLHEPKGADTATSGKVYVSNGTGSGVWTAASDIITNTAFTTGDTKFTLKAIADTGWILGDAGTIGDGSSGGSIRANADTSALFLLLWTNFSNSLCPVSTGRGASAVADYAAHKTITLPDMWQRVVGVAGSYNGSGQTSRINGAIAGSETQTLVVAHLPVHTPAGTVATTTTGTLPYQGFAQTGSQVNDHVSLGSNNGGAGTLAITATSVSTFIGTPIGSGTSHSIIQPTVWINIMIKL